MLALEEAQKRLLALAPRLPVEYTAPGRAFGLYLAAPLSALRTQPSSDLSAMDGYAVSGNGPWERVGEARAGTPFEGDLADGECVRISTGARMPDGSDRVLIQENAQISQSTVTALEAPEPGQHVRRRGFDFQTREPLLDAGTRMGPAQVALAISAGHANVAITREPGIAIIDSGDELAADAANCGPDQIPASNGAMIDAMLAPYGCDTIRIGPVKDDLEMLAQALDHAGAADIVITSGGASVGDHDLIQEALRAWGAKIDFWKVAIKPGKPLMVATREGPEGPRVILGLPGNPVSSFVTAFLFALPLIRASLGDRDPLPKASPAIAAEDLSATGKRREFLRAVSDGGTVRLAGSQDSSALMALARANCLIDRPVGASPVRAGEPV
ncbi:MAG: molybdopterin molybdotransferase MoeA, partial [Pseudomonadota bacterium]